MIHIKLFESDSVIRPYFEDLRSISFTVLNPKYHYLLDTFDYRWNDSATKRFVNYDGYFVIRGVISIKTGFYGPQKDVNLRQHLLCFELWMYEMKI